MSLATIRTALKTKLDAVTGVENVYDYVYWTDDWQVIYDKFATDGRINTWMIGLANNTVNKIDVGNRTREYQFNLYAYYSLKTSDESSKIFENILDLVVNEFLESFSFLDATTIKSVQIVGIDNSTFAGTPAHRAQLQMTIEEITAQDLACSG